MSSAGSAYTFRFPRPRVDNGAATSSCIPCGLVRRRDGNKFTASVLGCRFGSSRMRKILKMYHRTALQPLVQTIWSSKRRTKHTQFRVSLEEGVTVHGRPCTTQNKDPWEEARKMLDASLDIVGTDASLEQSLHETARMFQLAIEKQRSLTKGPWFAKAWLGIDQNAWIKSIAYQAAVHALIQAAMNIAGRREGKGSVVCTKTQQSLLHLCKPLEDSINQHLSARDPTAEDWLWCQQHSVAVGHFISQLEKDPRFIGLTILDWQEGPQFPNKELDATLLILALSICATFMKLGPGKVSCSGFSVELAEETGRLMDSFVEYASIDQVYHFTSSVGLRSEFLSHFGPRAALDKGDSNLDEGERVFWIELVQRSLRGAFAREGFHSKLSSFKNVEVLEQDLAVFGFFAALGRRARSFLAKRKVDLDDSLLSLFRYMEGGCVLFYPQLSTLTTYQLFAEVVNEELLWIPLFQENFSSLSAHGKMEEDKGDLDQLITQEEEGEALATVLNVCSYWVDDFMMYSNWIQQAESVGTVKFLSNIQSRLCDCIAATSRGYQQIGSNKIMMSRAAMEVEKSLKRLVFEDFNYKDISEQNKLARPYQTWDSQKIAGQSWSRRDEQEYFDLLQLEEQLKFFDKDLQTVEEVLFKLEGLLKKSDLSKFQNWKVHLTAIRINLRKIRRLKKEAEVLEVSLKHKAALKERILDQTILQQGYDNEGSQRCSSSSLIAERCEDAAVGVKKRFWQQRSRVSIALEMVTNMVQDWTKKLPFFSSSGKDALEMKASSTEEDDAFDMAAAAALEEAAAVSKEAAQFEVLRLELIKLDSRIRECTGEPSVNDVSLRVVSKDKSIVEKGQVWEFLSKSTDKFKNASLDVLKGTQLLGMDVTVAIALFGKRISGHELTERERKNLKRTLTDLASVIPIGFLMLLPVTAVGHAAILAAIQKYIPALIPSAYASERLDLLKQLEQLREMEVEATASDVNVLHGTSDSEGAKLQVVRGRRMDDQST